MTADRLEVIIDVIIHATEDGSKLLDAFNESLGISSDKFSVRSTTGHYDNPISVLSAVLKKGQARDFLGALIDMMSASQKSLIMEQADTRTSQSRFHLRFGKQDFLRGRISFEESDAVRLRISSPVYNKKETAETFRRIFSELG